MSHIALVIDQDLSPSATKRFVLDVDRIRGISEIDLPGQAGGQPVVAGTMTCPESGAQYAIMAASLPVQPRTVVLVSFISPVDGSIDQVYVTNSFDEVAEVKIFGDRL